MKQGQKDLRTPFQKWLDRCPKTVLYGNPDDPAHVVVEVTIDAQALAQVMVWLAFNANARKRPISWPLGMDILTARPVGWKEDTDE